MSNNAVGPSSSPPGSPSSPTAPASPMTAPLSAGGGSAFAGLSPQTGALTTTTTTPGVVGTGANAAAGDVTTNANGTVNNNTATNGMGYGSGYGSGYGGMGYGGMGYGMDPYGMGMGGLGMMGGMGGLGMMGMGGMGMMGMGMYGMTPEAQRAQMMMMMTNSIMQLWGMFSQVMQMTLGSAVQFVGEYVGINQRLGQIEEEHLNLEERYQNRKYDLRKALADIPKEQRYVPKPPRVKKPKQPSFFRRFIVRLLRHVAFFVVAYFLARRIASWVMARSGKKLIETSASSALSATSKKRLLYLALAPTQQQYTHRSQRQLQQQQKVRQNMSGAAKRLFKNVGVPILGFGIGWAAFTAVEQNQLLGEATQRWLNVHNLKLQLYTQRVLPASLVEKYGYPEETLQSMIALIEKGYSEAAVSERMTFEEVLRQCAVPEQMAYLEEHASEEIPYFYIADIFHSWSNLNVGTFAKPLAEASAGAADADAAAAPPLVLHNNPDFDSAILCHSLYDKMLHNVIPFDVSIRALCVLAVNNKANAQRLARVCAVDEVVRLYADYADKLSSDAANTATPRGPDVVAPTEVTAATLFFLRAINDASIHTRWVPLLGAPSTGPYPLLRKVQPAQWCHAFGQLSPAATSRSAETAVVLADVMGERLKCAELLRAEQKKEDLR